MVTVMCENFGSTFAPKDRITNGFLCFVCRISVGGPPKHSTDSTDVFFPVCSTSSTNICCADSLHEYASSMTFTLLMWILIYCGKILHFLIRRVCDKNPFTIKLLSGCDSIIHFGVISSSILGNCRSPNKHR